MICRICSCTDEQLASTCRPGESWADDDLCESCSTRAADIGMAWIETEASLPAGWRLHPLAVRGPLLTAGEFLMVLGNEPPDALTSFAEIAGGGLR